MTGGEQRPRFVPEDFAVPPGLVSEAFVLEPLGEQHNRADLRAWTSSIAHIRATPGYPDSTWPQRVYSLEENAADLRRHAADFSERTGFTYTVLDPADRDVIGCVYIYPSRDARFDADVRSWVTAERAELDRPLYDAVSAWLAAEWPFAKPKYATRNAAQPDPP
jgi:hypothetical protein